MIQLQTKRLLLRDHRPGDLPTHHALFSDPEVMRYLPDLMTATLEESEANLRKSMAEIGRDDRTLYFLRIEESATGDHVGEIGYTVERFTTVGKLVGMGYFIHRRFWGLGYTSEALGEMLRFAFEDNDVCRVTTGCLRENAGSERVMQKCGLIKEADRREFQWHDGKLKDRVEYRLLRSEWREAKNAR